MINKPSICWLCWKPMMMKWSKCTKYLSAQICPESHNFLKSDLFSGPEMGQILRVNIWRVSHILDIISRLTSSARWNYTVHGNHYFDVLCLPSMYPSNISLAVMCLSPWHDTTYDSNSFDVVSRHETIIRLIFTNPTTDPPLACFLPTCAGELIRWNQSSTIFGRLCWTLPASRSKTWYSIKYSCSPLQDQNWDEVSISSKII